MKKPIIGITLDLANDNEKYAYAKFPWYALRKNYADCVVQAGGLPIMIPYSNDIDGILNIIDGFLIPGGDEDIHPRFYGEHIISDKIKTNDSRAEFEFRLTEKALERKMPTLGICGGMQMINVVLGGSLIQHIPDCFDNGVIHEQPDPKDVPTHSIFIEPNSLIAELANVSELKVNSTHHQALNKLGENLFVSARASDGVIEAVESEDFKFLVGVQWHCEYLNSDLDRNLFKRLVEESAKTV